jgi:HD domain
VDRVVPASARAYMIMVSVVGIGLIASGAAGMPRTSWPTAIALAILLVVAESGLGSVRMRSEAVGKISVTGPLVLACVLLIPAVGVPFVTAFAGVWGRTRASQRLFNVGMFAAIGCAAAWTYHVLHGQLLTDGSTFSLTGVLLPYLVAALVSEAANGLLIVTAIALIEKVSPLRVWYGSMAQSAMPIFVYSVFGLMLGVTWSYVGPISALLVLAPLLVSRWVYAEFALRQEAYERTMKSLIQAVETKDYYTRGHSERVSTASVMVGRRSGMREDRVTMLRYAGMLHDVGKLGVPTDVLQASGKLTDEQYEAIQLHPTRGREITKDLEFLGEAVEGIYYHHERIDGRGYPIGLKGSEIPEFARIIAVADAFDSMTTTRSYRGARTIEDAVQELRRCKGSQFDPVMVEALVEAVDSEGWNLVDTSAPVAPVGAIPSFGSDDDDPTVAGQLGLIVPVAVPADASELEDDEVARGGER